MLDFRQAMHEQPIHLQIDFVDLADIKEKWICTQFNFMGLQIQTIMCKSILIQACTKLQNSAL